VVECENGDSNASLLAAVSLQCAISGMGVIHIITAREFARGGRQSPVACWSNDSKSILATRCGWSLPEEAELCQEYRSLSSSPFKRRAVHAPFVGRSLARVYDPPQSSNKFSKPGASLSEGLAWPLHHH